MKIVIPIISMFFLGSCLLSHHNDPPMPSSGVLKHFKDTVDGKPVSLYVLGNANGMQVQITNYGATIVKIIVPDKNGKKEDVVLGYDSLPGYYSGKSYFGTTVGRYANRIGHAKFTLDGATYTLAANDGANTLHGGLKGFNKAVWDAKQDGEGLTLTYTSKDGEEGFPGNLTVELRFTLGNDNALHIKYSATTDKTTVLNLSNHSYFNLDGQGNGDILGHQLTINAGAMTPVDGALIPTGQTRPVEGTPFDFTSPHTIGERVNDTADEQIRYGIGYDHNFILNGESGKLRLAASVSGPLSGRTLEVYTTEPGVQFYCGNFLNGSEKGKGSVYGHRYGFCLETQHFPDSPNQPGFPTTVLRPGERYSSETVYKFGTL